MAQSKMTTDMAYSKVEETVRGLISEKMMLKSQIDKLQRDLMARDKEAQENSNLVVQLQSEKEQLIQENQQADRETERLATTVQLNIQKHEILKLTHDRLKRSCEALGKRVQEGEEWRNTRSKNLTDIIEALDRDLRKKSEELEKSQIDCKQLSEQIESMKQRYEQDCQDINVKMEQLLKARKHLEQKLEVSESSQASLDLKVASLTDELAGSHATTEALREEIRLLKMKLDESYKSSLLLTQSIESLEAMKTEYSKLIEGLKQDLTRKEATIIELATANEKQKLDIEDKISALLEVQQAAMAKENEHLQTVNSLQEALGKSEEMNVKLEIETKNLQQQLSQLTLEKSSLMTSIESKQSALRNAEEEVASLTEKISSLNLETVNLQTLLNGNNDKIQKLEDENIVLEEAKDRLEAAINDHMANVKTLEEAKDHLEAKINDHMANFKNLDEASRAKEEAMNHISDQLKDANAMLQDLMGQKGKLEEALIEKSSLIVKLEEDWKLKEAAFQEILTTMKTESEGDVGSLNALVADLQYKLREKELLLTSLQEEVDGLKSTQMELLTKQAEDNNEIQQREATIENLSSRIQNEEKTRIELENQLTVVSTSRDEALGQVQQSCEEVEELRKNLEAARTETLGLTEQLQDARSASEQKLTEFQSNAAEELELKACAIQALNAQVFEANNKVTTLDKELSSLRKSITQSSRAFENERQSWGETRTRLENKVHALGEEIVKHIEMGQQSRAEVERLSSKVKSVEAQNRRMTADLENMTGELSTARAAVELKARECESLNQEQAKLWNEIQQKSDKIQDLEKENKTLETDVEFFMKLDNKQPSSTKVTKAAVAKGESTKKTTATRAKTGGTKTARPQLKSYSWIQNPSKPRDEAKDDDGPAVAAGTYAPSPVWTSTPNPEAEPIKPLKELLGGDVSFTSLFAESPPPPKDLNKGRSDAQKTAAARRFWGKKY